MHDAIYCTEEFYKLPGPVSGYMKNGADGRMSSKHAPCNCQFKNSLLF